MISYIYIYIYKSGVAEPPSRYHFWYLFKTQGAHHEIYKTTGVYMGKKLCLSNKHLVILWVISIGYAYNFVFPIITHDWLCFVFFFFFWRVQFLSTCYFDTRQTYMLLFVQNMHTKYTKYYLCIEYHLWYNYKTKIPFLVLIKTTWGTSWNV